MHKKGAVTGFVQHTGDGIRVAVHGAEGRGGASSDAVGHHASKHVELCVGGPGAGVGYDQVAGESALRQPVVGGNGVFLFGVGKRRRIGQVGKGFTHHHQDIGGSVRGDRFLPKAGFIRGGLLGTVARGSVYGVEIEVVQEAIGESKGMVDCWNVGTVGPLHFFVELLIWVYIDHGHHEGRSYPQSSQ